MACSAITWSIGFFASTPGERLVLRCSGGGAGFYEIVQILMRTSGERMISPETSNPGLLDRERMVVMAGTLLTGLIFGIDTESPFSWAACFRP